MKIVIRKNNLYIKILIIAVILLFPLIFFAKNIFLAALVNGTPIARLTVIKELEKQNGKRTLDSLITQQLIFQAAKKKNLITVGLLGSDGGVVKKYSDYPLIIPSRSTPRIQEAHITIGHIICDLVEKKIFNG